MRIARFLLVLAILGGLLARSSASGEVREFAGSEGRRKVVMASILEKLALLETASSATVGDGVGAGSEELEPPPKASELKSGPQCTLVFNVFLGKCVLPHPSD